MYCIFSESAVRTDDSPSQDNVSAVSWGVSLLPLWILAGLLCIIVCIGVFGVITSETERRCAFFCAVSYFLVTSP